ncbi:MAG: hypothetical protein U5K27_20275 [Desulfotignum sp.]|nr:hypothetical protein [Desulfotignum sp.]
MYEELEELRVRIRNASKEPTYGLHRKKRMPFFPQFREEIFGSAERSSRRESGTWSLRILGYR